MDWVPEGVTVVNNRDAHADRAGEYGLMAVLMLHNRLPAIIANQPHARRGVVVRDADRRKDVAGESAPGASAPRRHGAAGRWACGCSA